MHHFLFEFITGGGLSGQDVPESLFNEGELMLRTLVNELTEAGYSDISVCRDKRFKLNLACAEVHDVEKANLAEKLSELLTHSDVAWLIAPETNGCLYSLARLFVESGKLFIGSSPGAIKLSTSKLLTYKILTENNINTIETCVLGEDVPESDTGWLVKPDDGVGSEGCLYVKDKKELAKYVAKDKKHNLLVQPYIAGELMSMSLLVLDNDVRLLACNKQYVELDNNEVNLKAIDVNECLSYKDEMLSLARNIIKKINGFAGYIGIDVIAANDELYVLDINPRFTTAYAGLSESLNFNVAVEILNTFTKNRLPDIDLSYAAPVKVNIA